MTEIGIIGGSGFYNVGDNDRPAATSIELIEEISVDTPYGSPSDRYKALRIAGRDVLFLPRHGAGHSIAPHKVNYRANIWGFSELGVNRIFAVGATGAINKVLNPGDMAILDQIIDMTHGRPSTFYEEGEVYHVDFTEPFCPQLRACLIEASKTLAYEHTIYDDGVYVCTQGPRLETRREISAYSCLGADVVGMTAMPEAILARELQICYSTIAVVTNHAAGVTSKKLTVTEVKDTMAKAFETLKTLLTAAITTVEPHRQCLCKDALKDAKA